MKRNPKVFANNSGADVIMLIVQEETITHKDYKTLLRGYLAVELESTIQ